MSSPWTIDPQASGWYDDGSESGALRTREVRGDLVPIPFDPLQYYAELVGTATAAFQTTGVYSNPDGSATGINVSVPAGLTQGARLWVPFYGQAFGVRWRRDNSATDYISVTVDGVPVAVNTGTLPLLEAEGLTTQITDAEARAVTHEHLDPGVHVAEIAVVSDPSTTQSVTLYGLLLDSRAGYRPLPRVGQVQTASTLTTSAVEIPVGRGTALAMRAIRKVLYVNTSAAAVTVTVKNSTNTLKVLYLAATGNAGDCGEFDPGSAIAASAAFTHQASANTAVTATVIGEY